MPNKHNTEKSASPSKPWLRWFFFTGIKLAIALSFALAIFVIYLDAKVQKTFEGQRWQVPAQIYGKIESLHIGDSINVKHITESLKINNYSKVTSVTLPGQFAQSSSRLIIYRRGFSFPTTFEHDAAEGSSEESVKLTIDFKKNKITKLFIEKDAVDQIKLEPILLARLVPDNKEDRILVGLEQMPTRLIDTLLLISFLSSPRYFTSQHFTRFV